MKYFIILLLCLFSYETYATSTTCVNIADDKSGEQKTASPCVQNRLAEKIPFKKEKIIGTTKITTSYILLLIVLVVVIVALSYFRKRLNNGANFGLVRKITLDTKVDRLNVLERKRLGGQTSVSLLSVDNQLLVVVESNSGVTICELKSSEQNTASPSSKPPVT